MVIDKFFDTNLFQYSTMYSWGDDHLTGFLRQKIARILGEYKFYQSHFVNEVVQVIKIKIKQKIEPVILGEEREP